MNDLFKPKEVQKLFADKVEGKTAEEKRKIEMALLKPTKLKQYTGEVPKYLNTLDEMSINIVFSNREQYTLFNEFFIISESCKGERYVTNMDFLFILLKNFKKKNPGVTPAEAREKYRATPRVASCDVGVEDE